MSSSNKYNSLLEYRLPYAWEPSQVSGCIYSLHTAKEALENKLTSELLFWLALDVFHRARVVMLFR